MDRPRDPSKEITFIWKFGASGTGKSRDAFSIPNIYPQPKGKWWPHYRGQEAVLFDDYRADWFRLDELLKITDRYPLMVETKNAEHFHLQATTFVVTTTDRPEVLYHRKTGENLYQLIRRISLIEEYTKDGKKILKDKDTDYVMLERDEIESMFPKEYQNIQF